MARYEYKAVAIDSFDFRKKVEQVVTEWGNKGWRVVELAQPRYGERFVLLERKKRRWRRNSST